MLTYILYALLAWFLYNLIFRFIIPIYRASRQMKKKFREMHNHMQQQQQQQQAASNAFNQQQKTSASKAPAEDYIDFEEVK